MRSIKFRGIRIDNGEWVYGSLLQSEIDVNQTAVQCFICERFASEAQLSKIQVVPESVGEYIGLHDKNGKEIYEGDVVAQEKWVSVGKYAKVIGIVKYKGTCFTCECTGDWAGSNAELNGNATVIGNIHEHPHLIHQTPDLL